MPRDPLISLTIPPGFASDGTEYQQKARWIGGDLVRFFQKKIMPIGGWSARTLGGVAITGEPRGAISYQLPLTYGGIPVTVVGTASGLYAIKSDTVYDITPASFATYAADGKGYWSFDVFGSFLSAVFHQENALVNNHHYMWEGDTAAVAYISDADAVPAAASSNSFISTFTTEDRFLVLLGGFEPAVAASTSDPWERRVIWGDRESFDVFTPSDTNAAGSFPLSTQGSLRVGKRVRGGSLLLTTIDAWLMRYIGGTLVHSFEQVGESCGIIGARAAITADVGVFWMGLQGFFSYDGFVRPIPCEVRDEVFNDIERTKPWLIWGFSNPAFGEVTWFYPSSGASHADKYVTYNYRENHFVTGSLARAAGVDNEQGSAVPVLFDASGVMYDHETGTTMTGAGTPYLESGPFEIGEGDQVAKLDGVIADLSASGALSLTVYSRFSPLGSETTTGPTTLTSGFVGMRAKGRQLRVKFTQLSAAAWRLGVCRFAVGGSSRR